MSTGLPPLVLTGASGFVGQHLLRLLRTEAASTPGSREVTLLVRPPTARADRMPLPRQWRLFSWDMASEGDVPASAITRGSVVLHLAAATGRLSADVMRRTNVEGTRRIAEASKAAGAAHLVFVSSIAAGFSDRRWYHYADAKRQAEEVVRRCGVGFSIVRPTMVFGPGSPIQAGLARLAVGALPIVLGSGRLQVQPVFVDDLATMLLALGSGEEPANDVLEVGGGQQCSMRELLSHMRTVHRLAPRRLWAVPLGLPRLLLAAAEPMLGTRLPVTAGQLASFLNDSVATPHPTVRRLLPAPRGLEAMFEPSPEREAPVAGVNDDVAHEFLAFARYLGTSRPPARATSAYVNAHPLAAAAASDALDRWLVVVALRSRLGCALAESYARLARPHGLLRRKLVLALAVLESTPHVHVAYDTARPSSHLASWAAIMALGAGWALRTAAALLLLAPMHLATKIVPRWAPRG